MPISKWIVTSIGAQDKGMRDEKTMMN